MKAICSILTFVLAALLLPQVSARAGGLDPNADPLVHGYAFVRMDAGVPVQQILDLINAHYPGINAHVADSISNVETFLIEFNAPTPVTLEARLKGEYKNPGPIKWGDLVYEGQAPEGKTGSTWVGQVVFDTSYTDQYLVPMIGADQAAAKSTGANVVVAVLDTGIDASHPELASSIAPGGFNFIANSDNTSDVGDGIDTDGDKLTDEMTGHGTYVAGLIHLVAPDAKLLPVVVLNSDGIGDGWSFLKGIRYAMDHGVEVMNLSLATTYDSEGMYEALEEARQLGIIVVAAAGNISGNQNLREYPATMDPVIELFPNDEWLVFGVAAVDHDDVKASFSKYNRRLFMSAPGDSSISAQGDPTLTESIVSTLPGGEYRVWEGTSMATPLVSGAAALMRSQHPEWPANLQTFKNVRDRFMNTAIDLCEINPCYCPPPNCSGVSQDEDEPLLGVGRIDIAAAVELGPTAPQAGDLNGDGVVAVDDLLKVISDWGQTHTSADITGNGIVDVDDLLFVINNWS
jgi:subtilisin family serine protease